MKGVAMPFSFATWRQRAGISAFLLCLAILGTPQPAQSADAPSALRVALIAPQSPQEVEARWTPLLAALSRRLGIPVGLEVARDYAGAIWSLRTGRTHLAWLGNKSAAEAVDHADAEIFARAAYPSGESGYHSLLIVARNSPFASADAVIAHGATLTFAQGDANSTSGTVIPGYYLFAQRRVEPHTAFKRVIRGNHEDNVNAVAEGRADAATVASLTYEQLLQRRPELAGRVRVVWRSPLIPADPMVWRRDLPSGMKADIAAFFLGYGKTSADERAILRDLDLDGFVASDNAQLTFVRLIDTARQRSLIEADTALPERERLRRLREADRRMAVLEHGTGRGERP
jgi:phosphonate transport system substrate-binding protein